MNELQYLLKRFGWQGGTIHQARQEAEKRGWKPFFVNVITVPPIYMERILGTKPISMQITLWGKDQKDAESVI